MHQELGVWAGLQECGGTASVVEVNVRDDHPADRLRSETGFCERGEEPRDRMNRVCLDERRFSSFANQKCRSHPW